MSFVEFNKGLKTKAGVLFPFMPSGISEISPEGRLDEAVRLAEAIYLDVVLRETVKLREIKPAAFFGQGYIENLKTVIAEKELELLIIDSSISPIQQRNLEKALKTKVIDRTALILEIFGERANTREGNLQVELAHLTYQRSRLVRSWTHLERQRGGAGFLGGPGETQIELDRRIIDDKIVRIKKELEKVKKTRELQRGARKKVPYPVVALVGYTNAGKSSLFNRLTAAGVFAQDLLFATLDPTMRKIRLKSGREVILSDTVGFISDLPHELIMAFRATLEEVLSADIVVHVRDVSNPETKQQRKDVLSVLKNLGLEEIENRRNYIELLNKTDLLDTEDINYFSEYAGRTSGVILTSVETGLGCEAFLDKIDDILSDGFQLVEVSLPVSDGARIAWLHNNAEVLSVDVKDTKVTIRAKINKTNFNRLSHEIKVKLLQENN